jgi:hypothetical protein
MAQETAIGPPGGRIAGATFRPEPDGREAPDHCDAATSRALVTVSRAQQSETRLPGAVFLAQLIACDRKLPQTRERRRAEPHEAAAVYTDAFPSGPAEAGRTLSRLA